MAAKKKKYASKPSAAARFMSTVHDDLLLDILIRLPRMGDAMTVCKSWYSLIMSDHPDTFLRHTRHHHHRRQSGDPDPSYIPPCTLLFWYLPTRPCIQVLSEKSKVLEAALSRQSPQRNFLGLPSYLNSEAIKASFNDSLLIDLEGQYCIYNPVTREQCLLPNPPSADDPGKAKLVLVGSEESTGKFRLKVVKFVFPHWVTSTTVQVFSSETGRWNESRLNLYPPHSSSCMVAAGGALHWMHNSSGIGVYDPFQQANFPSSCRFVKYPFKDEHSFGWFQHSFGWFQPRIGAVRGRFRLSYALNDTTGVRLRILELKNGDEWSWVQHVRVETSKYLSVAAFHPEDEDAIFMSSYHEIFRCELKAKRLTKVGEVSTNESGSIQRPYRYHFEEFSLVHHSF